MDPAKKFKTMLTAQLSDVSGLSLSPDDGNQGRDSPMSKNYS
jgi:hypothetical protein